MRKVPNWDQVHGIKIKEKCKQVDDWDELHQLIEMLEKEEKESRENNKFMKAVGLGIQLAYLKGVKIPELKPNYYLKGNE